MPENVVHRVGVAMNPATARLVKKSAVPAVSEKTVILKSCLAVQPELVQNLVEMSKFIMFYGNWSWFPREVF